MFGTNPIRRVTRDPLRLAVESIFPTIQGEGPEGGNPALFVRLAGCNLACHFCDTEFESQAENLRPIADVIEEVRASLLRMPGGNGGRLVVMTGGEPMRQDWSLLADALLAVRGTRIQVETAGTLWQDSFLRMEEVNRAVNFGLLRFVCSPKTPGINTNISRWCRDWKYIIRASEIQTEEGLPYMGTQPNNRTLRQRLYSPTKDHARQHWNDTIWLSPCDEQNPAVNKLNTDRAVELVQRHGYRLSLQTHKIVGVA